jgi:hypothetical protein
MIYATSTRLPVRHPRLVSLAYPSASTEVEIHWHTAEVVKLFPWSSGGVEWRGWVVVVWWWWWCKVNGGGALWHAIQIYHVTVQIN